MGPKATVTTTPQRSATADTVGTGRLCEGPKLERLVRMASTVLLIPVLLKTMLAKTRQC